MDESLDAWFAREILIHEDALVSYLRRTWSNRDEVHDLRQETYIRVYEAAGKARPATPKSFMFATARHLMTDRLPDRCREVVWLRRVEELPQKEVAARLGINEKTVEKHVAKGVRLIAEYFYANGQGHRGRRAGAPEAEHGNGHGQQQTD